MSFYIAHVLVGVAVVAYWRDDPATIQMALGAAVVFLLGELVTRQNTQR